MALIRQDLDFPRALVKLRALEKDQSVAAEVKGAIFVKLDKILGLNLQNT